MPEKRFLRVEFSDPKDEWDTLFIDLLADEQMKVVPGPPVNGWWGKARSEAVWPFTAWCDDNGVYTMDLGEWNEEGRDSRYRRLSLPDELVLGADASFDDDDEPVHLKLKKATDICKAEPALG